MIFSLFVFCYPGSTGPFLILETKDFSSPITIDGFKSRKILQVDSTGRELFFFWHFSQLNEIKALIMIILNFNKLLSNQILKMKNSRKTLTQLPKSKDPVMSSGHKMGRKLVLQYHRSLLVLLKRPKSLIAVVTNH